MIELDIGYYWFMFEQVFPAWPKALLFLSIATTIFNFVGWAKAVEFSDEEAKAATRVKYSAVVLIIYISILIGAYQ